MSGRARERRRVKHEIGTRPRQSPANLLILTVVAVLGATAAAAAVMGGGFDDVTPHGQLLGDLQRVADAQERHYAEHGEFAAWIQSLNVASHPDIRVTLIHGGSREWEALAHHSIGLSCTQAGRIERGLAWTDPPACFTTPH